MCIALALMAVGILGYPERGILAVSGRNALIRDKDCIRGALEISTETRRGIAPIFPLKPVSRRAQDSNRFVQEVHVIIQSVELVALPNAPVYQSKIYRAHLDTGEDVDLFQQHWDVPLPPESLVGLTPTEARRKRTERILRVAEAHC